MGLGLSLGKVLGSFLRVLTPQGVPGEVHRFVSVRGCWWEAQTTAWPLPVAALRCQNSTLVMRDPGPAEKEEQELLCPSEVSAQGEIFHSEPTFVSQKPPRSPGATWGRKTLPITSWRFSSGVGAPLLRGKCWISSFFVALN